MNRGNHPGGYMTRPMLTAFFLTGCVMENNIHTPDHQNSGIDDQGQPGQGEDIPTDAPDDLELSQGDVWGQICAPAGDAWVVGAHVYVDIDVDGDGTPEWRAEDWTDEDGAFLLTGLTTGMHTINVEKGSFRTTFDVEVDEDGTELSSAECLDPDSVSVAVVTGEFDAVEQIIRDLGIDYDIFEGRTGPQYVGLLTDPDALAAYDIVFLNCGINDMWRPRADQVNTALNQYVASGGSIYASDWAFSIIENSFAERIDFLGNDSQQMSVAVGREGTIDADVVDPDMQGVLGGTIAKLNYDLGNWAVISDADADILIKGNTQTYGSGRQEDVPLAVQFDEGGRVIYTTFHNENQLTVDMEILLREIILKL